MLSPQGSAARRARLWAALPRPCDALILNDPAHLIYFANFATSPFEFRANDASAVLILQPDRSILVVDNLLRPYAQQAHVDEFREPVWYEGRQSAGPRRAGIVRAALEVLKSHPGHRFGVEMGSVPGGLLEGLRAGRPEPEWVDLDPVIRPLRRPKDPDELELIRLSLRAIDAGMAAALHDVEPGMTERDVYLMVQRASFGALGRQSLVYGDFLSGPRCEGRTGPPTDRVIEPEDLVLLDFSVVVHGYRGDTANTFVAGGGTPGGRRRELFTACSEALSTGEAMLRPGVPCRDVDAAVRGTLARHRLDQYCPSHVGHGLGLGHPEPPFLVPESSETLQVGDVMTLEPGVFLPGIAGMRFERNYLITPEGYETLSGHRIALTRR